MTSIASEVNVEAIWFLFLSYIIFLNQGIQRTDPTLMTFQWVVLQFDSLLNMKPFHKFSFSNSGGPKRSTFKILASSDGAGHT